MLPSSWYQFCLRLPLEVRIIGVVLFLQVLTLVSVLHYLSPVGLTDRACCDDVFTTATDHNNLDLLSAECLRTEFQSVCTTDCVNNLDFHSCLPSVVLPDSLPPDISECQQVAKTHFRVCYVTRILWEIRGISQVHDGYRMAPDPKTRSTVARQL